MKTFKIISTIFFACLILSCTGENEQLEPITQIEQVNLESLNTYSNRQAIIDFLSDKKQQEKVFKELGIENPDLNREEDEPFTQEELDEYMSCSTCPSEYKAFFYPMFQEFLTLEDSQIIERINYYESQVDIYNSDEITKENIRFNLFLFKASAEYAINNKAENNRLSARSECCGRAIGQGLVTGFVTGCIRGAAVGAAAGTVTVPVIGTVTGAVGGCIASGAVGAIIGAATSAFWAWVNS